ncbi:MAG: type II toxin-antitoxin system VapC family toxin [Candidatus Sumerlaeota bacterium]|nr:type II toxin-antitoxin system VapC family toxin [Candidatus Sumerlaeota bacterium]
MNKKPTLYLETSVPSILTARPSRNIILLAKQQITRIFWEKRLHRFEAYISEFVIDEVSKGDKAAAEARLKAVKPFPLLTTTDVTRDLAKRYMQAGIIPAKKVLDAFHIAIAATYSIDYLLTWNCAHIASLQVQTRLRQIHQQLGLSLPFICSPEEAIDDENINL